MARPTDHEFDPTLIDLHLGRASGTERAEAQSRRKSDPQLANQHNSLDSVFQALDAYNESQPPMPADLIARITSRVAAAGSPPRVVRPSPTRAADPDDLDNRGTIIRLHSFREIAAVAAVIVLAIGLGVPSMLQMQQRGSRIACSANLFQVGRGVQAYANTYRGSLPFAGWASNNSWRPTDQPGVAVLPNRRHVYALLRNGNVLTPAYFVCPSSKEAVPMAEDQITSHDDFVESRNLSYAYQNMAGVRPSLEDDPDLPILADDNPLFDNGWPVFGAFGDPSRANSRSHGGRGQNILTLRGNVRWLDSPNGGIDGDNIWTLNGIDEYTGREGPESSTDAHLLK